MIRYRDKDYIRTTDGLLFNVLGYDHPPDRVTCHLRYLHDQKWKSSYQDAMALLTEQHPRYVQNGFISVAIDDVDQAYHPQQGLARLLELNQPRRTRVQQSAIDLAQQLAELIQVPMEQFGVTDSLLWGGASENSDVDLVVYGTAAAARLLQLGHELFEHPSFESFPQTIYEKPARPRMTNEEFERLCQRKASLGFHQGRRFSVRAVREGNEISTGYRNWQVIGPQQHEVDVVDNSESLFFPAVYQTQEQLPIVSYWMLYEGTFQQGERLRVRGMLEMDTATGDQRLVVGSIQGKDESIHVV